MNILRAIARLIVTWTNMQYLYGRAYIARVRIEYHTRKIRAKVSPLVINSAGWPEVSALPGYRQRTVPSYSKSSLVWDLSHSLAEYGQRISVEIDASDLRLFLFTAGNDARLNWEKLRRDCDEMGRYRKHRGGDISHYFARDHVLTSAGRHPRYELNTKKKNKYLLYYLQDGKCPRCKRRLSFSQISIDHKHPKSKGGGDDFRNLQLMCKPCNEEKSNSV